MNIINKILGKGDSEHDAQYEAARREVIERFKAQRQDVKAAHKAVMKELEEMLASAQRGQEAQSHGVYFQQQINAYSKQIDAEKAKKDRKISGLRNCEASELAVLEVKFGKVVQTEPEKPWEPIRI